MRVQPITLMVIFVGTAAFAVPKHIKNPAFDAKTTAEATEPALKIPNASVQWEAAKKLAMPSCAANKVFVPQGRSKIEVVAFKNRTVPVSGVFNQKDFYLARNHKDKTWKGEGVIDLSSYDSKNAVRDQRIMRFILGVEKKGQSVAKVSYWIEKRRKMIADLWMGAEKYRVEFPISMSGSSTLNLKSRGKAHFTYVKDSMMDGLMKLIKRCNHEFLSSYVDLSVDLKLKNKCDH